MAFRCQASWRRTFRKTGISEVQDIKASNRTTKLGAYGVRKAELDDSGSSRLDPQFHGSRNQKAGANPQKALERSQVPRQGWPCSELC